jgi:hypothetical protein
VPETPTDVLDGVGKLSGLLTVAVLGVWLSLDRLGDVLNAHREMKPIEDMAGRTDARRLTPRIAARQRRRSRW